MDSNVAGFVGSIPEHYDQGLGPLIFADYAADIARRVPACGPRRVLETAAGTGIVTRSLRDHLAPGVHLTATDLNPPMLEIARAKFTPDEQVEFKAADATALPFPDESFDVVVCQFGVMFFPDTERSCREARRVVAPGGRYVFSIWDAHRYNPFGRIAHEAVARFFPADPPQFQSVPFSARFDPIKDALIAAEFDDITAAVVRLEKALPDPAMLARGLVYGSPIIDQVRARGGVEPEEIVAAMVRDFGREFGDPGRMPLQAVVFSATRPRA